MVFDQLTCPKCKLDVSYKEMCDAIGEGGYDLIDETIKCPGCSCELTIEYEEDWDGDDEYCYWYFTIVGSE